MGIFQGMSIFRSRQPAFEIPDIDEPDLVSGLPARPSVDRAPVHVLRSTARVRLNSGRLRVEIEDNEPVETPVETVSALHVHGWVHVTSAVVSALASLGAPVIWRSPNGYPLAQSLPLSPAGVAARRAQYTASANAETSVRLARVFVAGKIRSMRGLLRRRLGPRASGDAAKLERLARKAARASKRDTLLGFEGHASALYFARWDDLLGDQSPPGAFAGRTRRPPGDTGNAGLSYLYMVLLGESVCALSAAGLDPRIGFLHSERAGRPSLALDFMELYRAVIVDSCVLGALNRRQIGGATDAPGQLEEDDRRTLLGVYENRLATAWTAGTDEAPVMWRDRIHREAHALASALKAGSQFRPAIRL